MMLVQMWIVTMLGLGLLHTVQVQAKLRTSGQKIKLDKMANSVLVSPLEGWEDVERRSRSPQSSITYGSWRYKITEQRKHGGGRPRGRTKQRQTPYFTTRPPLGSNRVQSSGNRVQSSGDRVQGSGNRVRSSAVGGIQSSRAQQGSITHRQGPRVYNTDSNSRSNFKGSRVHSGSSTRIHSSYIKGSNVGGGGSRVHQGTNVKGVWHGSRGTVSTGSKNRTPLRVAPVYDINKVKNWRGLELDHG
ncbi:unnamed protein product, partial [Meganyctiphanes norvegica]